MMVFNIKLTGKQEENNRKIQGKSSLKMKVTEENKVKIQHKCCEQCHD